MVEQDSKVESPLPQGVTVDEISLTAGGGRLLAALAASDASGRGSHGPAARVDLDTLWIFISQVGVGPLAGQGGGAVQRVPPYKRQGSS